MDKETFIYDYDNGDCSITVEKLRKNNLFTGALDLYIEVYNDNSILLKDKEINKLYKALKGHYEDRKRQ